MDRFEISTLRSYYGALLTERQNELLKLRYDDDLSFGEISEIMGISRQAVLDGLNKGEKRLARVDEALGVVARDKKIKQLLSALPSDGEAGAAVKEILRFMEE